eukprot:TRINITY_DN3707_c1_g2_i1.p1 TRINITY_DN3707_c1_g2~~TRINITY_DN3707_c1_g2_i1.p1  ORF type:complete len:819 (+),score=144.23 TRINITY_DN3707_c1_g2_i1:77-2533(+)
MTSPSTRRGPASPMTVPGSAMSPNSPLSRPGSPGTNRPRMPPGKGKSPAKQPPPGGDPSVWQQQRQWPAKAAGTPGTLPPPPHQPHAGAAQQQGAAPPAAVPRPAGQSPRRGPIPPPMGAVKQASPKAQRSVRPRAPDPQPAGIHYDPRDRAPEDRSPRAAGPHDPGFWMPFGNFEHVVRGSLQIEGVNYARFEQAKGEDEAAITDFFDALADDLIAVVGSRVRREDVRFRAFPGVIKTVTLHYGDMLAPRPPRGSPERDPRLVDAEWGLNVDYAVRAEDQASQRNIAMSIFNALSSPQGFPGQRAQAIYAQRIDGSPETARPLAITAPDRRVEPRIDRRAQSPISPAVAGDGRLPLTQSGHPAAMFMSARSQPQAGWAAAQQQRDGGGPGAYPDPNYEPIIGGHKSFELEKELRERGMHASANAVALQGAAVYEGPQGYPAPGSGSPRRDWVSSGSPLRTYGPAPPAPEGSYAAALDTTQPMGSCGGGQLQQPSLRTAAAAAGLVGRVCPPPPTEGALPPCRFASPEDERRDRELADLGERIFRERMQLRLVQQREEAREASMRRGSIAASMHAGSLRAASLRSASARQAGSMRQQRAGSAHGASLNHPGSLSVAPGSLRLAPVALDDPAMQGSLAGSAHRAGSCAASGQFMPEPEDMNYSLQTAPLQPLESTQAHRSVHASSRYASGSPTSMHHSRHYGSVSAHSARYHAAAAPLPDDGSALLYDDSQLGSTLADGPLARPSSARPSPRHGSVRAAPQPVMHAASWHAGQQQQRAASRSASWTVSSRHAQTAQSWHAGRSRGAAAAADTPYLSAEF